MNQDLFKAILALDAYNRGYNAGIDLGIDVNATSAYVGTARTTLTSSIALETGADQAASFYAIAYEYNNQVVISYRGTDQILPDAKAFLIGGGFYQAAQAELAIKFFKAVDTDPEKNLSLTGHSLGGGLAAFVSTLLQSPTAGKTPNAVIFDNMPFELAAKNVYDNSINNVPGPNGYVTDVATRMLVYLHMNCVI